MNKFGEIARKVGPVLARIVRSVIEFLRRLFSAIRHVRTGGASTRTRARSRARAPMRRCSACHQPVPQSEDWRDHIATDHPEWA